MTVRATALLLALAAASASAQERPDEETLFGGSADAGTPPLAPGSAPVIAPAPDHSSSAAEQRILTGPPAADAFASGLVKEDALKIGGQLYIRAITTLLQDQALGDALFSFPILVDAYLDARPTDRLRAFVLGRLIYDPLQASNVLLTGVPGSTAGLQPVSNPAVYLDQAWLSLDIARAVFITAGRQHVTWGVSRYFNPSDFLASRPRDPLAIFDVRLGVSMLRVQVPWEKAGWNFTAVALFEPTQTISSEGTTVGGGGGSVNVITGTRTTANGLLEAVGGAGRIEFAFKGGAAGIQALAQKNSVWRVGADVTAGVGDVDLYAEAVLKGGLDLPPPSYIVVAGVYSGYAFGPVLQPSIPVVQAVGGLTYSLNIEGNKSLTLGAEYFFNSASFTSKQYPNLIFQGAYQPFYLGQNYLAASVTLVDPTPKITWVLTEIANLTDVTFITRVDFLITVLSYLQVEAFAAVDYGHLGGEFRLGFNIPGVPIYTGPTTPSVPTDLLVHAPTLQVGLGLRLAL
jgi:hypothetical protein